METFDVQLYKPKLHFSPQRNWLCNPNGLIYFEGEYHLFYQYDPHATVGHSMQWGHAVSTDWIQWEELEIVLNMDDRDSICSSSIVVDWNNTSGLFPDGPGMVAMYMCHSERSGVRSEAIDYDHAAATSTHASGSGSDSTSISNSTSISTSTHASTTSSVPHNNTANQDMHRLCIAYSHDRGRTWTTCENDPVLTSKTDHPIRDPKVFWYRPKGYWVMVVATGEDVSFYTSRNLLEWKWESRFGKGFGSHEGEWQCPDLFRLPIEGTGSCKWVLLISTADQPELGNGSRTQYFIGSFDGRQFMPEYNRIQWLDYGRDNYAGVSLSDIPEQDGRRIYMGWMNNWRYARGLPADDWHGAMTIPRTLGLRPLKNQLLICQRPVTELDRYFTEKHKLSNLTVSNEQPYELATSAEIADIRLHVQHDGLDELTVTIHHTAEQYTTIGYHATSELLSVRREH
ncbi:glycoside hydrolase family 32 protein [Paenibacillus wenxiniae]|uniref:Glycoside hydrolase family 32 protein n=1 Tax=Paenibacillus wenxiniae TaxID=1636843 RepID=A0ABW4RIU7_9BACL